jgi:hypothetical protein
MQLERHWVWRRVGSVLRTNAAVNREKLFRVRGFSEEGKWNPKCRCRCVYKVQNNDVVKGAFIEGNIQQCYGILHENFDAIKTFTVSYICWQLFRSWVIERVNFVSGFLMITYKLRYAFLLPNVRADTHFEISQTPKLRNSTKSMGRKCVMTL